MNDQLQLVPSPDYDIDDLIKVFKAYLRDPANVHNFEQYLEWSD